MSRKRSAFRVGHRSVLLAALVVVGMVVLYGCPGGGLPPVRPRVSQFQDASGRAVTDTNNNGVPDLPLDARPTVFPSLSGFAPRQVVEIQVLRDGVPQLPEPLLLTADANGNIPTVPVLWDIGVDPNTGQPMDASGTYTIVASGEGRQVTSRFEILAGRLWAASGRNRQAASRFVTILAGTNPRFPMGSVLVGEPVLAEGFGFPANQQVKLFVVRDKDNWQDGASLEDVSGGAETVTTGANGNLPRTQVWDSANRLGTGQTGGDYDVVVDVNGNDRFDAATDVVNANIGTGFTVQEQPRGRQAQHLAVELAASQQGQFKDEFNVNENVSVWVNPPWRPLTPYQIVRKYVVLHKDNWQNGDVLVDVTGRPEWDIMRFA